MLLSSFQRHLFPVFQRHFADSETIGTIHPVTHIYLNASRLLELNKKTVCPVRVPHSSAGMTGINSCCCVENYLDASQYAVILDSFLLVETGLTFFGKIYLPFPRLEIGIIKSESINTEAVEAVRKRVSIISQHEKAPVFPDAVQIFYRKKRFRLCANYEKKKVV